jgi:hypothetical protein
VLLVIKCKRKHNKKDSNDLITIKQVCEAFSRNGYQISKLNPENLEKQIRTFRLSISNEEYNKAEYRVIGKMDYILEKLWRLKLQENDNTASNVLLLFENTMKIILKGEAKVIKTDETKEYFDFPEDSNKTEFVVSKPAIYFGYDKLVSKGKVK